MNYLNQCLVCSGTTFKTILEATFSGTPLDAAPYFLGAKLSRLLVPVPIGLIYGAFEREG